MSCNYARSKTKKNYKIIKSKFFCRNELVDYIPKSLGLNLCNEYCNSQKMYNKEMVWNPNFKSIAPILIFPTGVQTTGPTQTPFIFTDVIQTTCRTTGTPLYDALTNTTFMVFNITNKGPILNDVGSLALLFYIYLNTPNLKLKYVAIPEDPSKPSSVSFYTMCNYYNTDDYKFWLMLDLDSHFTIYHKLTHEFEVNGVLNFMCTTENVSNMYLEISSVPSKIIPICSRNNLIAFVNGCAMNQPVKIADIECDESGYVIINYMPDIMYSREQMINYHMTHTKSLLLPLIPIVSKSIQIMDDPPIVLNQTKYTNISTDQQQSSALGKYFSFFNGTTRYRVGDLDKITDNNYLVSKSIGYNLLDYYFGVNTTAYAAKGDYYAKFDIDIENLGDSGTYIIVIYICKWSRYMFPNYEIQVIDSKTEKPGDKTDTICMGQLPFIANENKNLQGELLVPRAEGDITLEVKIQSVLALTPVNMQVTFNSLTISDKLIKPVPELPLNDIKECTLHNAE